jgi:L-threonylcarbamoyladenylate synthase
MKTQLITAEHVKDAATLLKRGGLVVFPTETVYGLGASAFNPVACARVFTAKGRPSDNPLIVHVSNEAQLADVAGELPVQARLLKEAFWPGPLSLIVPKNPNLPDIVTAGLPTVAVRWPRCPLTLEFLEACGVAVAAPSANVSGAPSPTTFEMAKSAMLGRVEGILAGEDCEVGLESTIVGFIDGRAKVLRPGGITAEAIAAVLGCAPAELAYAVPHEGRPLSPGTRYTHYKPDAEVRLFGSPAELPALVLEDQKVGVLTVDELPVVPEAWTVLKFADWESYGHSLYASFFELDRVGCTVILAQLPAAQGLGTAIANRLNKAAGS